MKKKITRLLKLFSFFSMLATTKIESRLNFCCISYLVHIQIWLNLPKDDRHFYYIFLCMTITKATLKKNTGVDRRMVARPPARLPAQQRRRVLISQTVVPPGEEKTGFSIQVGVGFHVPLTRFCDG